MIFSERALELNKFSCSICLIEIEESSGIISGTGFFIKIQIPSKKKPLLGLITNNHLLSKKKLKDGKPFKIYMNNIEKEGMEINIDLKKFIFLSELLDITFIELNNEIIKKINPYFFRPSKMNAEIDNTLLILQYIGKKLHLAFGNIKAIHGFDYYHKVSTSNGSAGSPLVNENFEVVGVHKSKRSLNNKDNKNENVNVAVKFSEIEYAIRTLFNNRKEYGLKRAKRSLKKLNENQIKELNEHGLELKSLSIDKNEKLEKILQKSLFSCSFSEKLLFYRTNYSWYLTILSEENNIQDYKFLNLKYLDWIHITPDCEVIEENSSSKLNEKENELINWLKSTELKYL